MNSILNSLTQHASDLIMFLLIVCLALTALCIKVLREVAGIRSRFKELLRGVSGESLEGLLKEHLVERLQLKSDLTNLQNRLETQEAKMKRTKRHLGLVRYDAFDDVGGAQSFALALYDDGGDGVVLNGLVGRSDCRVYCKALADGKSHRNLSTEELQAVEKAVESSNASEPSRF